MIRYDGGSLKTIEKDNRSDTRAVSSTIRHRKGRPFDDRNGQGDSGEGEMFNAEPDLTAYMHRTDNTLPLQSVPLYSIEGTAGLVPLFADHAQTRPVNFIHIPNLPKCDGAIYIVGDSMYPLLKSGDIVLYKQLKDIGDIFWGDMYLLSIDIDGEEYITVKYIQKSEREGYVKLVSQNPHHADKEVAVDRIRALALVKASIRMNSIR